MKTNLVCLFVLGLLAAGCGKNKRLEAAESYEKTACACKDVACANAAAAKYASDNAAAASSVPSASEAEGITRSATAAGACLTKLAMDGSPATPTMPAK